jgi:hypothetical protein
MQPQKYMLHFLCKQDDYIIGYYSLLSTIMNILWDEFKAILDEALVTADIGFVDVLYFTLYIALFT